MLDHTLAETATLCQQEARWDTVGKDLEDRDVVSDVAEVGVNADPGGEFARLAPGGLVITDTGVLHLVCHVFAHSRLSMLRIVEVGVW